MRHIQIKIKAEVLGSVKKTQSIQKILNASLTAIHPSQAIQKTTKIKNEILLINGQEYQLNKFGKIYVIGFGKAVQSMAVGIKEVFGERITAGIIITKHSQAEHAEKLLPKIKTVIGGHPIPDQKSLQAAEDLIQFTQQFQKNDLVICLISGGGSALFTKPANGISLLEIQELTDQLLKCGATINEINTIRKHIDEVKGGKLARMIFPTQMVTLILSDVIGDSLSMIASGPATADETTYQDAMAIIINYQLENNISKNILEYLQAGAEGKIRETVKPNDAILKKIQNVIIGNNYTASFSALKQAEEEKYNSEIFTNRLQGNAVEVGKWLGRLMKEVSLNRYHLRKPICLIAGGETTVVVKGNGLGGRNQEVALACALEIEGRSNMCFVALATDGEDGPTDAAGAIITGETVTKARSKGLSPEAYLANNDSYHFLEKMSSLIKTGPTGTNVNDLYFLFVY